MRVIATAAFVAEVPSFHLVEALHVIADIAQECMACDEPWTECVGCGARSLEREAMGLLRTY